MTLATGQPSAARAHGVTLLRYQGRMEARRHQTLSRRAALAAAGVVLLGACAPDEGARPGSASAQQQTRPFNRADERFVTRMLPRVRTGIDLSEVVLAKTGLDQVTSLQATSLRDTFTAEEKTFTEWLTARQLEVPEEDDDPGPLSWEEMQDVTNASGAEARKPYFVAMIANHDEMIELAQKVIDDGADPDLRTTARDVVRARGDEIDEMKRWVP